MGGPIGGSPQDTITKVYKKTLVSVLCCMDLLYISRIESIKLNIFIKKRISFSLLRFRNIESFVQVLLDQETGRGPTGHMKLEHYLIFGVAKLLGGQYIAALGQHRDQAA